MSNDIFWSLGAYLVDKFSTEKITSPGLLSTGGNLLSSERPTIAEISSFISVSLLSFVITRLPSRKTEIWSQISNISSILCDIYINEIPCSFNCLIILNNFSTSGAVSDDVGSSSTITFELYDIAFAISHICLCDTDIFFIGWVILTVIPSFLNKSEASFFILPSSTTPIEFLGYLPKNKLSTTLLSRHWLSSWCTIATPFSSASLGPEKFTSFPSNIIVPSSFW